MNPPSTSWADGSELAMVRDWFYPLRAPQDPYNTRTPQDMRTEATARVNIWTLKSHRTPPAILSTADLTDSVVSYEAMKPNDPSNHKAVQFMLAFAFLRFVNGFVDRDVAKAATAALAAASDEDVEDDREKVRPGVGESSMYAHAAAIGMPARFVDLRHQVSHGVVPEVRVLVKAAEEALEWLWERWWKSNATGDSGRALMRWQARREVWERMIVEEEAVRAGVGVDVVVS